MKKLLTIIIAIAIAAPFFTACKKGENDPMSLKSRKARLVGEWELSSSTDTYTNNDGDITTTVFNGTTFTTTYSTAGVDPSVRTGSVKSTIEKDGTYIYEETKIQTETDPDYVTTKVTKMEGVWYWGSGNKELETKNKEILITQITKNTYTSTTTGDYPSSYTYTQTYEGSDCPISYMKLDKLSSKEMIYKSEGKNSYTDDNGTDISSGTSEGTMTKL